MSTKQKTIYEKRSTRHGIVALSSVLIIMAVALSIITTMTLMSVGSAQSSLALTFGDSTLNLAESCAEDVLLTSRLDSTYVGGTINYPNGTCTVGISKAGEIWTATLTASQPPYQRVIQIVFNRTLNPMDLTSWTEI